MSTCASTSPAVNPAVEILACEHGAVDAARLRAKAFDFERALPAMLFPGRREHDRHAGRRGTRLQRDRRSAHVLGPTPRCVEHVDLEYICVKYDWMNFIASKMKQ